MREERARVEEVRRPERDGERHHRRRDRPPGALPEPDRQPPQREQAGEGDRQQAHRPEQWPDGTGSRRREGEAEEAVRRIRRECEAGRLVGVEPTAGLRLVLVVAEGGDRLVDRERLPLRHRDHGLEARELVGIPERGKEAREVDAVEGERDEDCGRRPPRARLLRVDHPWLPLYTGRDAVAPRVALEPRGRHPLCAPAPARDPRRPAARLSRRADHPLALAARRRRLARVGRGALRQRRRLGRSAPARQSQCGAPLSDVPPRARGTAGRGLQPPLPPAHPLGVLRRPPPGESPRALRRRGLPLGDRLRLLGDDAVVRLGLHELDRRGRVDAVVRGRRSRPGRRAWPRGEGAAGRRGGAGARPPASRGRAGDLAPDARLRRDPRARKGTGRSPRRETGRPRGARLRRYGGGRAGARLRGSPPAPARGRFSADLPRPAPLLRAGLRRGGLLPGSGHRVGAAALRRGPGTARRRRELARRGRGAQPRLHLGRDLRSRPASRPAPGGNPKGVLGPALDAARRRGPSGSPPVVRLRPAVLPPGVRGHVPAKAPVPDQVLPPRDSLRRAPGGPGGGGGRAQTLNPPGRRGRRRPPRDPGLCLGTRGSRRRARPLGGAVRRGDLRQSAGLPGSFPLCRARRRSPRRARPPRRDAGSAPRGARARLLSGTPDASLRARLGPAPLRGRSGEGSGAATGAALAHDRSRPPPRFVAAPAFRPGGPSGRPAGRAAPLGEDRAGDPRGARPGHGLGVRGAVSLRKRPRRLVRVLQPAGE